MLNDDEIGKRMERNPRTTNQLWDTDTTLLRPKVYIQCILWILYKGHYDALPKRHDELIGDQKAWCNRVITTQLTLVEPRATASLLVLSVVMVL